MSAWAWKSARAPAWTVFVVTAKYDSSRRRRFSPVLTEMPRRLSGGKPGGGVNRGWNPPADSAKSGFAPTFARSAKSPVIGNAATCESLRVASTAMSPVPKSMKPAEVQLEDQDRFFAFGQPAGQPCPGSPGGRASAARGGCRASTVMIEAQPSLIIGPKMKRPSAIGKPCLRFEMISVAWATGFGGKSRDSRAPVWIPVARKSWFIVRLMPIAPPTPLSVNP